MSTKTDDRVARTKAHKNLAPVAKTARASAKKSEGTAIGAAATKAGRNLSTKAGTKAVADKKRGSQKPKPAGIPEAAPEESKASEIETSGVETVGVETAAENAVSGDARDGDAAETIPGNDVNGAGNPASTGDPIKPLTEAGKKRLVNKLLGLADSQATQGAFKITPADLIRLMQLHREMNPQKNRKVTVQWIEDKAE